MEIVLYLQDKLNREHLLQFDALNKNARKTSTRNFARYSPLSACLGCQNDQFDSNYHPTKNK